MSFSSVCVVSNALRLRFFKPKRINIEETHVKGETKMKKTLNIEGMMCQHCVKHVNDALEKVSGVSKVQVDLEGKKAEVTFDGEVGDEALKSAVEDAGYEVKEIK